MRKIFGLSSLLLITSFLTNAQEFKNEFGLNLFKYNAQLHSSNSTVDYRVQVGFYEFNELQRTDFNKYSTIVTPQIFFSRQVFKNIKWRSEFQYLHRITNQNNYTMQINPIGLKESGNQTIKSNRYYVASGVQFLFMSHRKVHPYVFGIANFNALFSNLTVYDTNGQYETGGPYDPWFELAYTIGFGGRYRFSKRFSTCLEISENSSFESHLLSRLSINYHF